VEAVREKAARLLHCEQSEVAFTKNTSEGLNVAACGIDWRPGDNVVLSQFEHPSNTYAWLALARRGVEVRIVRPPGRVVTAEDIIAAMDNKTRAVACSAVTYMPGERLDLAKLSARCGRHHSYLVVDAVQALGVVDLDARSLGLDLLATSAHKGLLTPHGVGFMFCRKEIVADIQPAYVSRSSMSSAAPMESDNREYTYVLHNDARRFEYGNQNYGGITALGAALDLILGLGVPAIEAHVLHLSGRLIAGLEAMPPGSVEVLTPRDLARRAGIVGLVPRNLDRVTAALREAKVVFTVRRDAIRFGLGFYNTTDEVDHVLAVIGGAVQ
jgi:cysteine desulfurase/selenocysteine lyase